MSMENPDSNAHFEADKYIETNFDVVENNLEIAEVANGFAMQIIEAHKDGDMKVVSVIGGPASGKSRLAQSILATVESHGLQASSISTDDYNLGTREWRWERERDDPLSLKDFELLNKHIVEIAEITGQEQVNVPLYDAATGKAIGTGEQSWTKSVGRSDLLIVEGDFDAVEGGDLLIFVDVPNEARLQARIDRDLEKRGQADAEVITRSFYSRHEKQYIPHTEPALLRADYVLKVDPIHNEWHYDILQRAAID